MRACGIVEECDLSAGKNKAADGLVVSRPAFQRMCEIARTGLSS